MEVQEGEVILGCLQQMNREEILKSLSPLIATWSFLMQAIHFLVFKQVFGLGGRGYSSQRSAHRQCLHSAGTVPHQSYSQFWKAEGQLFLHLHFWA